MIISKLRFLIKKMDYRKKKDFFYTMKIWTLYMYIMVISPITMNRQKKSIKSSINSCYIVYIILFPMMNIYTAQIDLKPYTMVRKGPMNIAQVLYTFISFYYLVAIFVNIASGIYFRDKMATTLKNMVWLDETLETLGCGISYEKVLKNMKIQTAFMCCMYAFRIMLSFGYFGSNIKLFYFNHTPQLLYLINLFYFFNLVYMTKLKFEHINNTLCNLNYNLSPTTILHKVYLLKKCHQVVVQSTYLVNKCFELQNFNYILNMFVETSVVLYLLVKHIIGYKLMVNMNFVFRLIILIWPLSLLCCFTATLAVCTNACEQAKETGRHIHNLMIHCKDSRIKSQLELFSIQVYRQQVVFTVKGLFKLDFTLMYDLIGAISSYIMMYLGMAALEQ